MPGQENSANYHKNFINLPMLVDLESFNSQCGESAKALSPVDI